MSSRKVGLGRLKRVFGLLEHVQAMELAATGASLKEVSRAVAGLTADRLKLRDATGMALIRGEEDEQAVTRVLQQSSEVMLERLEQLRDQREELRAESQDRYQASRLRLQQMEIAVEWVTAEAEAQAVVSIRNEEVSRYMSRREWLKHRDERQKMLDE